MARKPKTEESSKQLSLEKEPEKMAEPKAEAKKPEPKVDAPKKPTLRDAVAAICTVAKPGSVSAYGKLARLVRAGGFLELMATDGPQSIWTRIPSAGDPFDVALDAKKLSEVVAALGGSPALDVKKDRLNLKSATGSVSLPAASGAKMTPRVEMPADSIEIDGEAFRAAVERVMPARSTFDDPRVNGVHVDGKGHIICGDGSCGFIYAPGPKLSVYMPPAALPMLFATKGKVLRFVATAAKMFFDDGDVVFSCALPQANFAIPYEVIMSSLVLAPPCTVSKSALLDAVKIASITVEHAVELSTDNGTMIVRGSHADGESIATIPCDGDFRTHALHPKYLAMFVSACAGDTIAITHDTKDKLSPIIITGAEPREEMLSLAMPRALHTGPTHKDKEK